MIRRLTIGLALLLAVSRLASAQTVPIAPTVVSFTVTDADVAKTLAYRVEFFQCAGITGGGGTNCATAPFQSGVDVPKTAMTSAGTTRTLSLTGAPAAGALTALPTGVYFVGTLIAVADPAQAATNSPRSAVSNPFLEGVLPLGAPTAVRFGP